MNSNIFSKSRRQLAVFALAATLALTATFGQTAVGTLFGADWTPVASACIGQGSNGGC